MEISPGPTSIRELLGLRKKITIPTYQRGYEWEKDQIEDFWASVVSVAEGEPTFFGPVVTLGDHASNEVQIVDGQQRLTTVFLTLSLMRDWVSDQTSSILFEGTEHQINLKTELRRELFFTDDNQKPDSSKPRFDAAERIRKVFRERVLWDPVDSETGTIRQPLKKSGAKLAPLDRRETKDLRRAKFQIDGLLKKYLEGTIEEPTHFSDLPSRLEAVLRLKAALIDRFQIFTLQLSSDDDAYILFESLNNRGLRLSPGDILRTISLRGVREETNKHEASVALALESWTAIANNLGEYDISAFMRHYLLAIRNERVQKKVMIQKFKDRMTELGAMGQIQHLERASEQYGYFIAPENHPNELLRHSSMRLNSLNETHRVATLGAVLADPDPTGSAAKLQEKFFRSVEFLTFRWLLQGGNAQELETLYQEILYQLRGSSNDMTGSPDYAAAVGFALSKSPSNHEIINFPRSERLVNLKYVFSRIEEVAKGIEPVRWGAKAGTLEHLAPQKATPYWTERIGPIDGDDETQTYGELVNKWGNLTLLEASLNKSIRNLDWDKKVSGVGRYRGLQASGYSSTKDLIELPDWTIAEVNQRTEWLASLALTFVSQEWVESGVGPKKAALTWKPTA